MSADYILYDVPDKQGTGWSLNPWKSRLALAFKGVPFHTEWTEYPDLEPVLKAKSVAPNAQGSAYTTPTICTPDGQYVMDSKKIAEALEAAHPSPSMRLDSPAVKEVEQILPKVVAAVRPVFVPLVPARLLHPRSEEYFRRTRESQLGMPLTEYWESEGGEKAWQAAEAPLKELAAVLKREGGPFVLGSQASYADFYIIGLMVFFKKIGDDQFCHFDQADPAYTKLYKAAEPYLKTEAQ